MQRLLDIFSAAVKDSTGYENKWLVHFALLIGVKAEKAVELLDTYGRRYVYAPHGAMVLPDTQANRNRLLEKFGGCVAVLDSGKLVQRKPRKRSHHDICLRKVLDYKNEVRCREAALRNKERAKRRRLAHIEEVRAEVELMDAIELQQMFKDCQGEVCPKRGGKANSHADIGQYVERFRVSISDYEGRRRAKAHII